MKLVVSGGAFAGAVSGRLNIVLDKFRFLVVGCEQMDVNFVGTELCGKMANVRKI